MAAQDAQKRVAPGHPSRAEHHAEHVPELYPADAGVELPYLTYRLDDAHLAGQTLLAVRLLLVKGLSASAKQVTGGGH